MKLKKHSNGKYYAHITGAAPINLDTKDAAEAKRLAKASKIAELEFANKARALTAEVVVRLTSGGKIKCEEAAEEWQAWMKTVGLSPSTIYVQGSRLLQFLREQKLADKMPTAVSEQAADAFVNPENGKVAHATRNSRLAALRSFSDFCVARGYMVRNPTSLLRVKMHLMTHEQKETKARQPFTQPELNKLAKLDDPFWRAAVLLGYETGLRIGDIATLERASLTEKNRIVIWTDKHDKRISLPISKDLYAMLTKLGDGKGKYVFPEEARVAMDVRLRSRHSTYFKRILIREGIEDKSFHSLRHTFATERGREGQSIDEIREQMGHTFSDTTRGYVHA